MKAALCLLTLGLLGAGSLEAGPYAPAAGVFGSTAIPADSLLIRGWASGVVSLVRGPQDISDPDLGNATFGSGANALGAADASPVNPLSVVSLGDGGSITLTFPQPIGDGPGADFAVFENSFNDTFLELAFVEVSSNGTNFFRFPSQSLTQTGTQIDQAVTGSDAIDPTDIDGLAGKYRAAFGTPFDLTLLTGVSPLLDVSRVTHVRIVDAIGSIDPAFGARDSSGRLINDPWPTPFASSGFDLDAVAVLNVVPEPATGALCLFAIGLVARRRRSF